MSHQGAVGLRIRVYDRIMCFVNCHFAAHLDAVGRRNADFDHVYRTMSFSRSSNLFNVASGTLLCLYFSATCLLYILACSWIWLAIVLSVAAGTSSAVPMFRGTNVCKLNPLCS